MNSSFTGIESHIKHHFMSHIQGKIVDFCFGVDFNFDSDDSVDFSLVLASSMERPFFLGALDFDSGILRIHLRYQDSNMYHERQELGVRPP